MMIHVFAGQTKCIRANICGTSAFLCCVGASLDQYRGAEHVKVLYLSSANLYESNDMGFDQI